MRLTDAVLALHPSFNITPEVFNTVNVVIGLVAPLVVAMVHPVVFVLPDIHQAVVTPPAIAVYLCINGYDMLNYGL